MRNFHVLDQTLSTFCVVVENKPMRRMFLDECSDGSDEFEWRIFGVVSFVTLCSNLNLKKCLLVQVLERVKVEYMHICILRFQVFVFAKV
jgi:hypothetical protein